MDHRLVTIKRLVTAGHYDFTVKAEAECIADGLSFEDVIESILTATFLRVKNSTRPFQIGRRERLYIIDGFNFVGIPIYSKGVVRRLPHGDTEYSILISGKRSVTSD